MSHLQSWAEEVGYNLQQEYSDEELAAAVERSRARQAEADERRRAVEERAAQALAKPRRVKKPKTGGQGLGRGRGRAPVHDRNEMVRLWNEGLKIKDIADRMDTTDRTVVTGLKAMDVYEARRGAQGRPPLEVCGKGHDMKTWRRKMKKGGSYCYKCRQEREQEYRDRRRAENKPKKNYWTDEAKQMVREWEGSDKELAEKLGRSLLAVQQMRHKLKKKEQQNG